MEIQLQSLTTEMRNPNTLHIDCCDTMEMLRLINQEDQQVPLAVARSLDSIARAVDAITEHLRQGGRLFYIGAGTSGRLGVLDASECPPTFGVDAQLIQAIIAGGTEAILTAREGLEDDVEAGRLSVDQYHMDSRDVLVAIAASGRTPFVLGAVDEARARGILTVGISNSLVSQLEKAVDIPITVPVGPEVVCGSTRLKAGTAQKLILNMLTTATMIKLGKVYENLMVDLKPTNAKLVERACQIIMSVTGLRHPEAEAYLEAAGRNVKTAIVMVKKNCGRQEAAQLLEQHQGMIFSALNASLEDQP